MALRSSTGGTQASSDGTSLTRVVRAAAAILLLIFAVPLILGIASSIGSPAVITLIVSTLLLQAGAAVVGLGFGLHPLVTLALVTSVAAGIMLVIFELSDLLASRSARFNSLLQKIDEKTKNVDYFRKYGVLILIPIIWIPGIALYGTPIVARLFQYPRTLSVLCMLIGWLIASAVVMAMALGIVSLAF
ncbi:hypothetical protein FGU65_06670 [Methanoculleus sp. FWC-SCC1]|uniref:Small multi-drug export protein n=1 Tax=Methanoculleus frigidifontis TaxID=2584085 RepID=A0ABT8M9J9_9EURY|nr:small multi-drug export protein [Methanoculleus sp. FWC-SCC1]MDN7024571.1 hypothetical protein [Methanoculleus sp. FWC-SCC1]